MQTRLLWRRSATAIGLYGSVGIGLLGGLVAARELHPSRYGLFSLAVFGAGFFQVLLDLTVEEAMIKYGFRYTTIENWGRLRQLYRRSMVLKTLGAVIASIALRDHRPVCGLGLPRPRVARPVLPRRAAADLVHPGGARRRRARARRPLRAARSVQLRHRGAADGGAGHRCALRRHRGRARARDRAVRRLGGGQLRGAARVRPLPRGAAGAARRGPQGDRPVRRPFEHRLDDRLDPRRGRAAAARARVGSARGRATSAPARRRRPA